MSGHQDSVNPNDIAIIGMALRVPGARNPEQFWENLRDGVESIRDLTEEELIAAGEAPERFNRKNYIARAAEMPAMECFDAEFFGMSPKEALIMDPQHRQFLECAWEATENATRAPETIEGPVGMFAGCGMGSYFYFNVCSHRDLVDQTGMFLLRHTGNDKDFLATRASFLFDLHGPSINVQTACSTSLVAVHYACQSLLSGECDMAYAGGVTIELPHRVGYLHEDGEILSPDGHCRAFDHRAAGTVFGSGTGVVVLRRLTDAIADGDPIRAVIKATAVNNDGSDKAGYLAPSVNGQAEAVVEALGLAGIDADTIGYVECHGTGTSLGDPIEIEALTRAYRQSTDKTGFCKVGSVKTNIGHLDTAAGIVSLIKATLALENEFIPPTLNYEKPNPTIPFDTSPFRVNDRLSAWPRKSEAPRRAGVNSLGVGGTNAHAILEEAPLRQALSQSTQDERQTLVITAKSQKALEQKRLQIAEFLAAEPSVSLSDVRHTLQHGQRQFERRSIVAVKDRADAIAVLSDQRSRRPQDHSVMDGVSGATFMFPGGGAQYPGMASSLYRDVQLFRKTVDEGLSYLPADTAAIIRQLWLESGREDHSSTQKFLQPSLQLPAILIVEVALTRLWRSHGIEPTALIGHSMGENTAACIAGVLSFEDAVKLVHLRGQLFDEVDRGGMLSVPLSPKELLRRLPGDLDIASVNAPELCVVSGPDDALQRFAATLDQDDIEAARIAIDIAAHSRMLEPILERFHTFLSSIELSPPRLPVVSNRTGTWLTTEEATSPDYWVGHLRNTVKFADGLATLAEDRTRIYIETGPGRTLSTLAKVHSDIDANQLVASLPHADDLSDDHLRFLTAIGEVQCLGLSTETEGDADTTGQRVPLPTYPFQHQPYFLERLEGTGETQASQSLVRIPEIENWGWQPTWKTALADFTLGDDQSPTSILLFGDDTAHCADLIAALRDAGHSVTTVEVGDSFAELDRDRFVLCPELGRDGYDQLFKALKRNERQVDHIIHLWLLTSDRQHRPGSSFFHRNLERGFYSLLHLAQALESSDRGERAVQFTVLTNGMQRVHDEDLPFPEKSTILGPGQVIPKELENTFVRLIDLPMDMVRQADEQPSSLSDQARSYLASRLNAKGSADQHPLVECIWSDIFAAHENEIVSYRGSKRWRRVWSHLPLQQSQKAAGAAFRQNGVYIITGGIGDLALACAKELAHENQARLVLVGRTELPQRSEWDGYRSAYGTSDKIGKAIASIRELEDLGSEVLYLSGEVTNPLSMARVRDETKSRFGTINGVLHTAGIVRDDLMSLKNVNDIEDVFAPKIFGTVVLQDVMRDEELDLMVLFSSTSTDTSPAGQVDYVAANAYLNAIADSQIGQGTTHTLAVHWGVWNQVGLAARAIGNTAGPNALAIVEPATQALFDRKITEPGKGSWFELRISPERHWLLDEHRLASGEALWPGTGYLELVAEAAKEYGLRLPIDVTDLTFLRPLYVPDDEKRTVRVQLERQQGEFIATVDSRFEGSSGEGWLRHAEAVIRPTRVSPPAASDIKGLLDKAELVEAEATSAARLRAPQEKHLDFGPRWHVLREVHRSETSRLARLSLRSEYQGDLERGLLAHPALLDIATGFAMDLISDYDPADGLWVPMTYGNVRLYRPLPAAFWSRVQLNQEHNFGDGYATFNVELIDDAGDRIADISGFTVRNIDDNINFADQLSDTTGVQFEANQANAEAGELSPALIKLAGQVSQGITPNEGFTLLKRALATGKSQVIVSSMDLHTLQRAAEERPETKDALTKLGRPDLASAYIAPRNPVEEKLAGLWSGLLGIDDVGVEDNFFDLGGHSLIAVRLFRMIKKEFGCEFPMSVLFDAPTIADCAALIASSTDVDSAGDGDAKLASDKPRAQWTHLVKMHPGRDPNRIPFFVCAGMFGNILNLRHLAQQCGQDRPVYGLQARGLLGDQQPHATFEEMARSNIAELRQIQPHGPYLIGGFSGGGLVAFEMARQLKEAGDEVAALVMLDTPFPTPVELSIADKLRMKQQELTRDKSAFLTNWIQKHIDWKQKQKDKLDQASSQDATQFHNIEIEAAFMQALSAYRAERQDGTLLLCRPRLEVSYTLGDGRELNRDRELLRADNGWTPYIRHLEVIEVPGDHDKMVLEPNVRVLAGHLNRHLRMAEIGETGTLAAAE